MSANIAEAWLIGLSVFSVLVLGYHLYHWRRDRVHWVVFLGALVASGIAVHLWKLDEIEFLAAFFLEAAAGAAVGYSLMQSSLFKLGPGLASLGASVSAVVLPVVLHALGFEMPRADEGVWVIAIPAVAFLSILTGLLLMALRACFRAMAVPGVEPGPRPEERAKVLDMLADGAISSGEAAELLNALGEKKVPADRLPLGAGMLAGFWGGLIVAVGFILPWGSVSVGPIKGYQAGYHLGLLGWIILLLAILPALLACIPALDRGLRQGLLRLLCSSVGLALTLSLGGAALSRGNVPGLGLWGVILGFAIQAAGGFAQSGIIRTKPASRPETAQE